MILAIVMEDIKTLYDFSLDFDVSDLLVENLTSFNIFLRIKLHLFLFY
jgi:hypothetical protein